MQSFVLLICVAALPLFSAFLSLFMPLSSPPVQAKQVASGNSRHSTRARTWLSFPAASALFPPSAIIDLTDDNSTFFLARPAAFGPSLPSTGLSGQLWLGRGVGEEAPHQEPGFDITLARELGCSDISGWEPDDQESVTEIASGRAGKERRRDHGRRRPPSDADDHSNAGGKLQSAPVLDDSVRSAEDEMASPSPADGTDDYLHHPLPDSEIATSLHGAGSMQRDATSYLRASSLHADIQSLQESAEISGKVVLLSRGGCGFLEKAKWVQRRGGLALIVGDDTKRGGLVTMFARGDTSNISIPSVFTSYTTAHLLSSLLPPDHTPRKPSAKKNEAPRESATHDVNHGDHPQFTRPTSPPQATPALRPERAIPGTTGLHSIHRKPFDSRRPPSSGQLDWAHDKDGTPHSAASTPRKPAAPAGEVGKGPHNVAASSDKGAHDDKTVADDFEIGVQDWRDPDVARSNPPTPATYALDATLRKTEASVNKDAQAQRAASSPRGHVGQDQGQREVASYPGGVVTPGSGQYSDPMRNHALDQVATGSMVGDETAHQPSTEQWTGRLDWLGHGAEKKRSSGISHPTGPTSPSALEAAQRVAADGRREGEHEGLWVTLTPSTASSSPFFDTLLVLVVSPLVTLSVVYTLLVIRSKIRRRRWRAPKSVVDQLPVRTYQTLSTPAGLDPPRAPATDSASPSSPLLSSPPIAVASPPPRAPRASTMAGLAMARSWPPGPPGLSMAPQVEPKAVPAPAWVRPYAGRQVECVICLEEYVDGVSRVMSLPCGHEFHAECITPWLTIRRRTCPICKGDVVRSLAHCSALQHREHDRRHEADEAMEAADSDPERAASRPLLPVSSDRSPSPAAALEPSRS
ncbi:MAG: hypothetical protein M1826_002356 [Phylliscum demangeonii]|nr:MAG: hypothetical protein M1826_002356 [Phylliscum demangeonii]